MTRFARPAGSPLSAFAVCPTGCRQLSNPGRGFSSPHSTCNMRKKSPYFRTSSFSEYGGEGEIDSLRSPCGQPALCVRSLSNWLPPVVEPRSWVLIPPQRVQHAKKSPYFRTSSFSEYGGEGGIRTPDTLPYTHFPGVLLQPLGHLTILSFQCCWNGR